MMHDFDDIVTFKTPTKVDKNKYISHTGGRSWSTKGSTDKSKNKNNKKNQRPAW